MTAADAVRLVRDGDAVATGGFVGIGFAEEIALALEELYLSVEAEPPYCTGKPRKTAQAMVFQLAISLMPVVRRRMGGPRTAVGHLRRADVNGMSVIAPIATGTTSRSRHGPNHVNEIASTRRVILGQWRLAQ